MRCERTDINAKVLRSQIQENFHSNLYSTASTSKRSCNYYRIIEYKANEHGQKFFDTFQIVRADLEASNLELYSEVIPAEDFSKIRLCFQENSVSFEDELAKGYLFNTRQILSFSQDILAVATVFLKHNLDLNCFSTSNIFKNCHQRWTIDLFCAERFERSCQQFCFDAAHNVKIWGDISHKQTWRALLKCIVIICQVFGCSTIKLDSPWETLLKNTSEFLKNDATNDEGLSSVRNVFLSALEESTGELEEIDSLIRSIDVLEEQLLSAASSKKKLSTHQDQNFVPFSKESGYFMENKKAILTMIKEDFLLAGSGGSLLIISLQTGKVIRRDILVQKDPIKFLIAGGGDKVILATEQGALTILSLVRKKSDDSVHIKRLMRFMVKNDRINSIKLSQDQQNLYVLLERSHRILVIQIDTFQSQMVFLHHKEPITSQIELIASSQRGSFLYPEILHYSNDQQRGFLSTIKYGNARHFKPLPPNWRVISFKIDKFGVVYGTCVQAEKLACFQFLKKSLKLIKFEVFNYKIYGQSTSVMAFISESKKLVAVTQEKTRGLICESLKQKSILLSFTQNQTQSCYVTNVVFSEQDTVLVAGMSNLTLWIFHRDSSSFKKSFVLSREFENLNQNARIYGFAADSGENSAILSLTSDRVKHMSLETGHEIATLNIHKTMFEAIALSPNDQYLALSNRKVFKVLEMKNGKEIESARIEGLHLMSFVNDTLILQAREKSPFKTKGRQCTSVFLYDVSKKEKSLIIEVWTDYLISGPLLSIKSISSQQRGRLALLGYQNQFMLISLAARKVLLVQNIFIPPPQVVEDSQHFSNYPLTHGKKRCILVFADQQKLQVYHYKLKKNLIQFVNPYGSGFSDCQFHGSSERILVAATPEGVIHIYSIYKKSLLKVIRPYFLQLGYKVIYMLTKSTLRAFCAQNRGLFGVFSLQNL